MVILGGGAVSYERGTPVEANLDLDTVVCMVSFCIMWCEQCRAGNPPQSEQEDDEQAEWGYKPV